MRSSSSVGWNLKPGSSNSDMFLFFKERKLNVRCSSVCVFGSWSVLEVTEKREEKVYISEIEKTES